MTELALNVKEDSRFLAARVTAQLTILGVETADHTMASPYGRCSPATLSARFAGVLGSGPHTDLLSTCSGAVRPGHHCCRGGRAV